MMNYEVVAFFILVIDKVWSGMKSSNFSRLEPDKEEEKIINREHASLDKIKLSKVVTAYRLRTFFFRSK